MPFENFAIGLAEKNKKNMIERSDGKVEETFEMNAEGKYQGTKNLIFTDKKGNKIDLAELLPEGWKLNSAQASGQMENTNEKQSYFNAESGGKVINYGKLDKDGRLFALLHEIGHAQNYAKDEKIENYSDILDSYTHNPENQKITREDIIKKGENPDDYSIIETLKIDKDEESHIPVLVPKNIMDEFARMAATSERNAHAYALKTVMELRKKGLEIEIQKSAEELRNDVHNVLGYVTERVGKEYGVEKDHFNKGKKFEKNGNVVEASMDQNESKKRVQEAQDAEKIKKIREKLKE